MRKSIRLIILSLLICLIGLWIFKSRIKHLFYPLDPGTAIDSLHGIKVYFNGAISNVQGRNISEDGYNLGLKYQCVEFVKRYYYQHYHHRMPDSYGHAVSFFEPGLPDSSYNAKRGLFQYTNPGKSRPAIGDLLVYSGTSGNPYGHVAIVSEVSTYSIDIIQQNPGIGASTRATFELVKNGSAYHISNDRILGWLRMK